MKPIKIELKNEAAIVVALGAVNGRAEADRIDYNAGVRAGRGGGGLRWGANYEVVRGYWDGLREVREAAASAAAEVGACSQSRA